MGEECRRMRKVSCCERCPFPYGPFYAFAAADTNAFREVKCTWSTPAGFPSTILSHVSLETPLSPDFSPVLNCMISCIIVEKEYG